MLCPRCRVVSMLRRQEGCEAFVCRNPKCRDYGRTIATRKIEVTGEAPNDNAGNAEKSDISQE